MKRAFETLVRIFEWSWIVTLPLVLLGTVLGYNTLTRFYTFGVRYDPSPAKLLLGDVARFEIDAFAQSVRAGFSSIAPGQPVFRRVDLLLSESNRADLESRMPQSGFDYVPAHLLIDGEWTNAKVKYRGDFLYHWAWDKKSVRVKTGKNHLFEGLRTFNLQAPKFEHQLNNYLSLQLADRIGLIAPKTELVSLNINNANHGIHVFVEQLSEETLRRAGLMPADLYRGEMVGKDAFPGGGVNSLFETSAVWDKMAINNHYDAESMAPLDEFLRLIRDAESTETQAELSEFLDIEAWARFSAFEALAQTRHYQPDHNWRLYYDPWRRKLSPIVWDPVGWPKGWWPRSDERAAAEVMTTMIHQALFRNGDFLRARARILRDFFDSGRDSEFLAFVDSTIEGMDLEISRDPHLQPADPKRVSTAMHTLRDMIAGIFEDIDAQTSAGDEDLLFARSEGGVQISVNGHLPVRRLRLEFESAPRNASQMTVAYQTRSGSSRRSLPVSVDVSAKEVLVEAGLLPSFEIVDSTNSSFPRTRMPLPALYDLRSDGIDPDRLRAVFADRGRGWEAVRRVEDLRQALRLSNPYVGTSDHFGQAGWQLFWDTGAGFQREQSTPPTRVRVNPNGLWTLARKLPETTRRLRVDLPPDQDLVVRDLTAVIDGKAFEIPIASLTLNSMERVGPDSVRAKPGRDPYLLFDFPVRGAADRDKPFATRIRFSVDVKTGSPWARAQAENRIGEVTIGYAPVQARLDTLPLVWKDKVTLSGRHVIEQPLVIRPGTDVLLGEGATLIIKNRLTAEGTKDAPIRFGPAEIGQEAWGAVVLMGPRASGSRLAHCEITQGSGLKTDLFEATAMLSVHDARDVVVSDCVVSDSRHTDDMVHAVYSEIRFERCQFLSAPFDAVDIDLSDVTIVDSLFVTSGNDALDLMTSTAQVVGTTLRNSGDKAISVGENSQLMAIDNHVIGNQIGIQVKDRSVAALFNLDMERNVQALDAFKKNWRYGGGGTIVLAKSRLSANKETATADKHSAITLFDSSVEDTTPSKRVHFDQVDPGPGARSEDLLGESARRSLSGSSLGERKASERARTSQRGAYSPAR